MRLPLDQYTLTQGVTPTHVAWDLAAPMYTPVLSPVTGTVIAVGNGKVEGNYVIVREDHPDGWEYYTGHHSSVSVKQGQRVKEGQQIASIGTTGLSTGPHTHFQIRQKNGGNLLNPQYVINNRKGAEMPNFEEMANYRQTLLNRIGEMFGVPVVDGNTINQVIANINTERANANNVVKIADDRLDKIKKLKEQPPSVPNAKVLDKGLYEVK